MEKMCKSVLVHTLNMGIGSLFCLKVNGSFIWPILDAYWFLGVPRIYVIFWVYVGNCKFLLLDNYHDLFKRDRQVMAYNLKAVFSMFAYLNIFKELA